MVFSMYFTVIVCFLKVVAYTDVDQCSDDCEGFCTGTETCDGDEQYDDCQDPGPSSECEDCDERSCTGTDLCDETYDDNTYNTDYQDDHYDDCDDPGPSSECDACDEQSCTGTDLCEETNDDNSYNTDYQDDHYDDCQDYGPPSECDASDEQSCTGRDSCEGTIDDNSYKSDGQDDQHAYQDQRLPSDAHEYDDRPNEAEDHSDDIYYPVQNPDNTQVPDEAPILPPPPPETDFSERPRRTVDDLYGEENNPYEEFTNNEGNNENRS